MLELRVNDLRLRGRGYTLFPAANEVGIESQMIDFLVCTIYAEMGLCSDDYNAVVAILEKNPYIIDTVPKKAFDNQYSSEKCCTDQLVKNELVIEEAENFKLTDKAINIIKRAAEIQKKLDDENFHSCPCENA